jgi:hypothetical protein
VLDAGRHKHDVHLLQLFELRAGTQSRLSLDDEVKGV